MSSKDHFSIQSDIYAKYRPKYPDELFRFLSGLCPEHELVWDCATGNGQAASSLSQYFKKVYASDLSPQQISNSVQKDNIQYNIEQAEKCTLPDDSVDLITVATAIHWFGILNFYEQVHRVLKPAGILAVWGYAGCTINEQLDKVLNNFAFNTLEKYWPPETKLNWKDRYESLPFPYPIMKTEPFVATALYNLEDLLNYLFSWSATQKFIQKHRKNPVDDIRSELLRAWGNPDEKKIVKWNLHFKCGRK